MMYPITTKSSQSGLAAVEMLIVLPVLMLILDCTASGGNPGQDSSSDGPYTIVLYKDPSGEES